MPWDCRDSDLAMRKKLGKGPLGIWADLYAFSADGDVAAEALFGAFGCGFAAFYRVEEFIAIETGFPDLA